MINHVRTLILNRTGAGRPDPSFYLEEYIDPLFRAIELDSKLQQAHDTLIEPGAANGWVNFRLAQYMRLLHSTEFEDYIFLPDNRVTYDHPADEPQKSYTKISQRPASTSRKQLLFNGEVTASFKSPVLFNQWGIVAIEVDTVEIVNQRTGEASVETLTFANNLTSTFSLPSQQNARLQFQTDSSFEEGDVWDVSTFTQPLDDLSDMLIRLRELTPDTLDAVFPNRGYFKTLRDLFEKNAILSYAMSGFLLAFALRTEELRHA